MRLIRNVRRFSQPLSILNCADKLLQNDPGFVELSLERLGDSFDIERFAWAIQANTTVRHVCFSGTFVRELNPEQWRSMLEAVGHLQTLEELQIWCSALPVTVFKNTIANGQRLQKVYFFRVTLEGNQEEFDDFAVTLKQHPSIRDFRIGGFSFSEGMSLDSVVEALAEMQSLHVISLQLSGFQVAVPFTDTALSKLLQSKSVTDLYLSRLGLQHEHFVVVGQGLANNRNLRVLDLFGNNVSNEDVILMAAALEKNACLETLVLPCPNEDLTVDSCVAISHALQVNKTLQTLNLPRSNLSDDGLLHIAEALTVNTTLKKIEVGVSKSIGHKGTDALESMLKQNYKLERFVVSSAEKSIKDKVEYYLRLNEVGRGTLLRDGESSREAWVEMLISVSNDLDCLFYFMSMNPSLCQFANTGRAQVIITEEFRPMARRFTIDHFGTRSPMGRPRETRRASVF